MSEKIPNGVPIQEESLSFSDLRVHFLTGRSLLISQTGLSKRYIYRTGVQTDIGDIEISEWVRLISALIERSGEAALQAQMVEWTGKNCPWLHSNLDVKQYALDLHASRMFDNEQWAGYEGFNQTYRPKLLKARRKE